MDEKTPSSTTPKKPWLRLLALSVVFGLVGGLGAALFHLAIAFLFEHSIVAFSKLPVWQFLCFSFLGITAACLLSGYLLASYCSEAAGSGIPQVKVAFWRDGGWIPFRVVWVKFLAGAGSIGAGASLGREGPSVQLAAGLCCMVARCLGVPKDHMRCATAAGSAAGLSAAFNAPLAAVTFVLEEVLGKLRTPLIFPILIASVVAALVVEALLGNAPDFVISGDLRVSGACYVAAPFVALVASLSGVVFFQTTLALRKWRKSWVIPKWLHPLAGGWVVWALGSAAFLWTGHNGVFGLGYADMNTALGDGIAVRAAFILLLGKLIATIACYGTGGCGGIFTPLLFFGCMSGVLCSEIVDWMIPGHGTGAATFGVIGMAAALGAVVRAPMTGVLIVLEMTRRYELLPVLLLGALVSQGISHWMGRLNFYDRLLEQDGVAVETLATGRS